MPSTSFPEQPELYGSPATERGRSEQPRAALDFYLRTRELDPSVEDDPYFLLSLGLALAFMHGFVEEGADELERAAEALAISDPASAAQATMTRGEFVWQRGDQDGAFGYFDRARQLADGAALSPEKQFVVAQVARFLSLAGRTDEALELVEQAIAMAQELDDDELLGDALNTRGIVRGSQGHPGWEEDSTRGLELALRSNSFRAGRAYINLGSQLLETKGDLHRAEAVTREGLAFSERMGFSWTMLRWLQGNLAEMTYLTGAWDEALALAESVIVGAAHYMQQLAFDVRGEIRMARGDDRGAAEDVDIALQQARAIRDPQALDPALVRAAQVAQRSGDEARAHALIDELGASERALGSIVVRAALVCHDLGRGPLLPDGADVGSGTPWTEVSTAIAARELERAAEILARIGARTLEADVWLRAARAAAADGRRAEAAAQLASALAFYREVGATVARPRGRGVARRGQLNQLPQRLNSTVGLPAAAHESIPPSTTGCASKPRAERMLAAIAARGPVSQIVTIGLSRGRSASPSASKSVRDVPAPGDVARVALVLFAHVDELGALLEERVQLVDRDELERLGTATEDVAGDVEDRDGAKAADGVGRLCFVGCCDCDGPGIEDERRLRRKAGSGDRNAEGAREVAGRERAHRAHIQDLRPRRAARRSPAAPAGRRRTARG